MELCLGFAKIKSRLLSLLRSSVFTELWLNDEVKLVKFSNVPSPLPKRMDVLLKSGWVVTRSKFVSEFRSPEIMNFGDLEVSKIEWLVTSLNVLVEFPNNKEILFESAFAVAISSRPSLLKSPMVLANGSPSIRRGFVGLVA